MDDNLKKLLDDILNGVESITEYKKKLEKEKKEKREKDLDDKYNNDIYYKLAGLAAGVAFVAAIIKNKGE